jgi:ribosome-binding factor A
MSIKQERMSERIREILSELLLTEVTDPALQGLTVTEVTLDPELEYAEVYVNALGEEEREKEVLAGFNRANGFLRREVGKRVRLRRTPYLRFHWDKTLSQAERIEQVLDRLPKHDAAPAQNQEEDPDGLE